MANISADNKNIYHKINVLKKGQKEKEERKRKKRRNITMIGCILILIILSILNMLSASFYTIYKRGIGIFTNHLVYMIVSFIALIITGNINYKKYNKNGFNLFLLIITIILFSFILIGARVFPSVVPRINGAIGWIRLFGFSLQPAELLKVPFIILIAHILERCEKDGVKNLAIVLSVMPIMVLFGFFIIFQDDLGTMIHYIAILLFMLFMSKIDTKWIVSTITAGIVGISGICLYVHHLGDVSDKGYKMRRIGSFLNGLLHNEYDNAIGYQVGQSLLAFGSGGILGKGYANGVQKYSYLPEIRTDFILASYGEELGFIGMFIIMIFFFLIFNLIKRTAMECKSYFGKYLAIGIGGYLITQVLINIYVALGMLPVFGIPMPIFSYGGTSLITIFSAFGIIGNINSEE